MRLQVFAASQALGSAMRSTSSRASARPSSRSSGRLQTRLCCSALTGPQRRFSWRKLTLASP